MRHLTGIITLMLLVSNISFASGNKRKANIDKEKVDTIHVIAKVPFIPNATIFTPTTVIYDDGINPEQYCGYTLFDKNNKEVLRVKHSVIDPVKLRLKAGDYIVKLDGKKNPVYRISVLENQYNEFVISESDK